MGKLTAAKIAEGSGSRVSPILSLEHKHEATQRPLNYGLGFRVGVGFRLVIGFRVSGRCWVQASYRV